MIDCMSPVILNVNMWVDKLFMLKVLLVLLVSFQSYQA